MTYAKTEQHSCLEALRDFPSVRSATPCHATPRHAVPPFVSFRLLCFGGDASIRTGERLASLGLLTARGLFW
jgi:hypothetical protein